MSDEQLMDPVWRAVMQLERRHYTKAEIAQALREVATQVEPEPDA